MKNILITGGSGFIGKKLSSLFLSKGYAVTGIGTSKNHPFSNDYQNFKWVSADTTVQGKWQDHVSESDIVINLAGRNIFKYWTQKYKQNIYDSRILTTRHIVDACEPEHPHTLLTTSAVGIYGDAKNKVLTEQDKPGTDFLATVCTDWEKEGLKAKKKNIRVAVMRFGVVLGDQGALSKMVPAFKFFAGGPMGSGQHWFPWIHEKDLERAIEHIIENISLEGIFNFVSPLPVQQKTFAKSLGRVLHRPSFFPMPAIVIRSFMGELGQALLQSQKALPQHLTDAGFNFLFPDIDSALNDIFAK